jgi:hypothetical protein
MNTIRNIAAALLAMSLLSSCEDKQAREQIADLQAHNSRLADYLKSREETNAKLIEHLKEEEKKRDSQFKLLVETVFAKALGEQFTNVDPAGSGFSRIESNNGSFMVSCKRVEPYLDGFKLVLEIGNPYLVTYSDFNLKCRYGPREPEGQKDATAEQSNEFQKNMDEWKKSLKIKELAFTEQLLPGTWTRVEAIITPAKAEDLGYFGVQMTTNKLMLREARD